MFMDNHTFDKQPNGKRTEPHGKFARLCYQFICEFVLLCAHLANYLDDLDVALAIHPVGRSTVHYAYHDKALDSDVDGEDDADMEQDK
ncbi:hypothetical protein QFZ77_002680 [Paenibacillus sp. V4I3]|uniref:hypothetical protein n=1 Tax=Paenibacillus sp. V4I3 TaxID=3042305 RepID=UPI00277EC588|nr:hypothetical protein [Paenibacillus sp. V4I3]MDQ0874021.1 hypothetical protein [Paenibacillus sp. V4I3]